MKTEKRQLTFAALLLLLMALPSCVFAQQRSLLNVNHIADNYYGHPNGSRRALSTQSIQEGEWLTSTDVLHDNASSAAFYVFQPAKTDCGFIIISGDERMPEILGRVDNGHFDATQIPAGLQYLLSCYQLEYQQLQKNGYQQMHLRPVEGAKTEGVSPLLATAWSQDAPFNNLCPTSDGQHCLTGCVAVTSSQIMYFYQYPSVGKNTATYTLPSGTKQTINLANYPFEWNKIRISYGDGYTEEEATAVARLLYATGAAAGMTYGLAASGASNLNQMNAMVDNFGYDTDMACIKMNRTTETEWQRLLVAELNERRPVIYSGTGTTGGHSFIIDGYSAGESDSPYYHVNWGWGGLYDGNFQLGSLVPAASLDFINENSAIIGIQPENNVMDHAPMLQTKFLSLSNDVIRPGTSSSLSITAYELYNLSYRPFSGTLQYYLRDSSGKDNYVGSTNSMTLNSYMGTSSLKTTVTIPALTAGTYTIVARVVSDNGQWMRIVPNYGDPTLTVTESAQSYTPNVETSSLSASNDGLNIRVSVEQLLNCSEAKSYVGNLMMAIADASGNFIMRFGNQTSVTELPYLNRFSDPFILTGTLPEMPDGDYRLYVMANQQGYQEWARVTKYTVEGGYINSMGEDCHLSFKVKDGAITLDKQNKPTNPANIQAVSFSVDSYDTNSRSVTATLTKFANFGSEFTGTITLAIADVDDNIIQTFGSVYTTSTTIGTYQLHVDPVSFSGTVPYLSNGQYHLCAVASQSGYEGYNIVKRYELSGNTIINRDEELCTNVWMQNGKLYLTMPDAIQSIASSSKTDKSIIYDLTGKSVSAYQSGILLIPSGSGYKKVMK